MKLIDVNGTKVDLWVSNYQGRTIAILTDDEDRCPVLDEGMARALAAALIRFADGGDA